MGYTAVNLKYKILELYPEIINYGIDIYLAYHPGKKRYELKLTVPNPESTVFLGKEEADACIRGEKSDSLANSIAKFIASTALTKKA